MNNKLLLLLFGFLFLTILLSNRSNKDREEVVRKFTEKMTPEMQSKILHDEGKSKTSNKLQFVELQGQSREFNSPVK